MPKPAKSPGARSRLNASPWEFKFRLRIRNGDVIAVGPGKIALLEAIEKVGSITAAARSLDMSYRRAWLLLHELNQSLTEPAIFTSQGGPHGGGSELTEAGRQLIWLYRQIEDSATRACQGDMERLLALLEERTARAQQPRVE